MTSHRIGHGAVLRCAMALLLATCVLLGGLAASPPAAYATITDVVPLRAANRYVARRGLLTMNRDNSLMQVMKDVLEINGPIDSDTIGFRFGPMINAASRVTGAADDAMRDLVEESAGAVSVLAAHNDRRKDMCRQDDAYATVLCPAPRLFADGVAADGAEIRAAHARPILRHAVDNGRGSLLNSPEVA